LRTQRLWIGLLGLALSGLATGSPGETALKLPPFQKVTLANGLTLMMMEQHEVPIVSFAVLMRAAATTDPAGQEGLAAITAGLLTRGTQNRTADQIATELDFVGGSLDFEAADDFTAGSGEFLKKDLAVGLDLLADVLRQPAFPEAEFAKLVAQRIDGLKQEKDEPLAVLPKYFNAALYGDHPYARSAEGDEQSLAKLRRTDVVEFYQGRYGPAATTIAVVGDFVMVDLERELRARFDPWPRGPASRAPSPPEPAPCRGRRLLLVNKPDATQTYFEIGNVGVSRRNPDRVGINLVNTVFGGRFTSLLNDALRVSSGLTYGARSSFDRRVVAGPFALSSYTPNATTVRAVDLALEVLQRLHDQGLSPDQLASAKAYLKGQFPPRIETTDQLAARLAQLDFDGLDQREVDDYFAKVEALTLEDTRRIIRQYFPRDNLVFVLVGKADEIRDGIRKYAPQWTERDVSQVGYR